MDCRAFAAPKGLRPRRRVNPGALTWDGRNRRAIVQEKKQSYSPRSPI
jgi:hypothetical protein